MRTTIAVDAMGGDKAPEAIIGGALMAAEQLPVDIILVGDSDAIYTEISNRGAMPPNLSVVHAKSAITMEDHPSAVLKEKADCSMAVAAELVRDGKADALVSAGNTGALFTVSSLKIRRLPGIRRAALGAVVPLENPVLIVDSGANTDATPELLRTFAHMGNLYASLVMGIDDPRVGLVNNGSEPTKGTPLYVESNALLSKEKDINFVGNVEGRDIPCNTCDVVVCDGFTGNILLKTIEGMGLFMKSKLKGIFYANRVSKVAGILTKRQITSLKKQIDHREHGGAPFLGLAKPVVKAHGSSDEKSIFTAIRQAKTFHESGLIPRLKEAIQNESPDRTAPLR
ncbi:MAG: phosphate acyltransferase PlsX [Clostridia bacterium]|nr:phosphate acyltransferase PlsX [Clostridia bacterium]